MIQSRIAVNRASKGVCGGCAGARWRRRPRSRWSLGQPHDGTRRCSHGLLYYQQGRRPKRSSFSRLLHADSRCFVPAIGSRLKFPPLHITHAAETAWTMTSCPWRHDKCPCLFRFVYFASAVWLDEVVVGIVCIGVIFRDIIVRLPPFFWSFELVELYPVLFGAWLLYPHFVRATTKTKLVNSIFANASKSFALCQI